MPSSQAGAGSPGATERVSVSSTGSQTTSTGGIPAPVISDDGRIVVYHTRSTGLVPNDTNDREDVFVFDRSTGGTTRINAPGDVQPDGPSLFPEISGDGRFVVFGSGARNLVPGDTNAAPPSPTASTDATGRDVFVWDRISGAITREDVSSAGVEGRCFASATSIDPPPGTQVFCSGGVALAEATINTDGRWVAFAANAQNLVAGDTNNQTDVFLRDRQNKTTTRISVLNNGTQATGGSSLEPDISADGRFVAYDSAAVGATVNNVTTGNLVPSSRQVLVFDRANNTSTLISKSTGGVVGAGASSLPSISADGRWVAFSSLASNLVPGDTNGAADVFLHDRETGTTTRISVGPGGVQAPGGSFFPSISGDGRFVTFDSLAPNLVADDTNARSDAFIYDRTTATTSRVSLTRTLGEANDGSFFATPNFDGRYVTFASTANNLVPGDSNDDVDVFVHDRTHPLPFADGYRLVASDGGIFAFNAPFFGSTGSLKLNKPIVGMASTPRNDGYWLVASDGGIFAFGKATFFGSAGALPLAKPIVGMAATPTGAGYWLVASDGGVFAYGDAKAFGSLGNTTLAKPIVGMASSPTGKGYYLVASDGGVFAFGDAQFKGSTGALKLNQPIVGMAVSPTGAGYWLVASDGGIFAFGDAKFKGSTGALKLNQPIVAMTANPSAGGYWLIARDGGIFAFGDAQFKGSTGAIKLNQPVVGGAAA
ncbi:MAG TPA: hypothetical protein VHM89_01425 [Acidimicrobiales bacterium]|nr:hypothetical protein [Acidimicrobiales bacterium]